MTPDDTTLPLKQPQVPHTNTRHQKRLRLVIIVTIGLVLTAIAIAIFMLLTKMGSPNQRQTGAFKVGANDYAYPCATFNRDDIAESFRLNNKEAVYIATDDVKQTNDKPVDLLALPLADNSYYYASCRYNFTVTAIEPNGPRSDNSITTLVLQYPDATSAQKGMEQIKSQKPNATALPSFKEHGYYATDTPQGIFTASGFVTVNNLGLIVHASLKNTDETANRTYINTAMQKAVTRVQNKQAYQPTDFTKANSINKQSYTDVCALVDGIKLTKTMQSVELRPMAVTSIHNLTGIITNDDPVANLQSFCYFNFRTLADIETQTKNNTSVGFEERFMHTLMLRKNIFGSQEDAKKDFDKGLETLKKPATDGDPRPPATDVAIGDRAVKVSAAFKDGGSDTHYYIQKGNTTYTIAVFIITSYTTDDNQKLESKGYDVKDDIIKAAFEQINTETRIK